MHSYVPESESDSGGEDVSGLDINVHLDEDLDAPIPEELLSEARILEAAEALTGPSSRYGKRQRLSTPSPLGPHLAPVQQVHAAQDEQMTLQTVERQRAKADEAVRRLRRPLLLVEPQGILVDSAGQILEKNLKILAGQLQFRFGLFVRDGGSNAAAVEELQRRIPRRPSGKPSDEPLFEPARYASASNDQTNDQTDGIREDTQVVKSLAQHGLDVTRTLVLDLDSTCAPEDEVINWLVVPTVPGTGQACPAGLLKLLLLARRAAYPRQDARTAVVLHYYGDCGSTPPGESPPEQLHRWRVQRVLQRGTDEAARKALQQQQRRQEKLQKQQEKLQTLTEKQQQRRLEKLQRRQEMRQMRQENQLQQQLQRDALWRVGDGDAGGSHGRDPANRAPKLLSDAIQKLHGQALDTGKKRRAALQLDEFGRWPHDLAPTGGSDAAGGSSRSPRMATAGGTVIDASDWGTGAVDGEQDPAANGVADRAGSPLLNRFHVSPSEQHGDVMRDAAGSSKRARLGLPQQSPHKQQHQLPTAATQENGGVVTRGVVTAAAFTAMATAAAGAHDLLDRLYDDLAESQPPLLPDEDSSDDDNDEDEYMDEALTGAVAAAAAAVAAPDGIRPSPPAPSPCSALHPELLQLAAASFPLPHELSAMLGAVAELQRLAEATFSFTSPRVVLFGSQASGLALPSSDLDIVILGHFPAPASPTQGFSVAERSRVAKLLRSLLAAIEQSPLAGGRGGSSGGGTVVAHARVPIIKTKLRLDGCEFEADIAIGVANGAEAVPLVRRQVLLLPPLRALVLAVKALLVQAGLNEVFTGGLSSYSLINMVIAHLQSLGYKLQLLPNDPAVGACAADAAAANPLEHLDPSQDLASYLGLLQQRHQCYSGPDLGQLLLSFLTRFGKLNLRKTAISVRRGGFIKKPNTWRKPQKPALLAIGDPQQMNRDIASGSYAIERVQQVFLHAHRTLSAAVQAAADDRCTTDGTAILRPAVNRGDAGPWEDLVPAGDMEARRGRAVEASWAAVQRDGQHVSVPLDEEEEEDDTDMDVDGAGHSLLGSIFNVATAVGRCATAVRARAELAEQKGSAQQQQQQQQQQRPHQHAVFPVKVKAHKTVRVLGLQQHGVADGQRGAHGTQSARQQPKPKTKRKRKVCRTRAAAAMLQPPQPSGFAPPPPSQQQQHGADGMDGFPRSQPSQPSPSTQPGSKRRQRQELERAEQLKVRVAELMEQVNGLQQQVSQGSQQQQQEQKQQQQRGQQQWTEKRATAAPSALRMHNDGPRDDSRGRTLAREVATGRDRSRSHDGRRSKLPRSRKPGTWAAGKPLSGRGTSPGGRGKSPGGRGKPPGGRGKSPGGRGESRGRRPRGGWVGAE